MMTGNNRFSLWHYDIRTYCLDLSAPSPPSGSYATYDVSENAFLPSWYYLFFYSKDARGCRKYHKISDNNMNIFEYVMSLTFWAEGTTVWTVPSLGYSNIVPWRGKVFRIFIERHGKQFTFLNKIVKCLKRVFECSAISSNCKIVPITSSFSVRLVCWNGLTFVYDVRPSNVKTSLFPTNLQGKTFELLVFSPCTDYRSNEYIIKNTIVGIMGFQKINNRA